MTDTKDKTPAGNSGFNKCGLTWVNQVKFFKQPFVSGDSFVLRNPALLKPANRYRKCAKKQELEVIYIISSKFRDPRITL